MRGGAGLTGELARVAREDLVDERALVDLDILVAAACPLRKREVSTGCGGGWDTHQCIAWVGHARYMLVFCFRLFGWLVVSSAQVDGCLRQNVQEGKLCCSC